ncbi:hypothetical protein ERN12_04500 [Rhodobacteraceae bacterium]|nr:hypothetical protein ERN12_04500 [Paracoccaceae bacterium]
MSDIFASLQPGLDAPASNGFVITPDDSTDLVTTTRGIYVGTSGDLQVTLVGDTAPVTFKNMTAGVAHPLRVARVHADQTTAQNLIALF